MSEQRLIIRHGDRLILRADHILSQEEADRIHNLAYQELGIPVLVIDSRLTPIVVVPEGDACTTPTTSTTVRYKQAPDVCPNTNGSGP